MALTEKVTVPEDQKVVIIGASSGIGAALVMGLGGKRRRLFAGARRLDRLEAVCDSRSDCGYAQVDAADTASIQDFYEKANDSLGGIDAVICCVGGYGAIGPVDAVSPDRWLTALQNNLGAAFLSLRFGLPMIKKSGRSPRFILFAGGGAFDPLPRYSAYAVSKAGIVRLMETAAAEEADSGILINAVAPGFVDTEIHNATLDAGPDVAGKSFHAMTEDKIAGGSVPIETPVACVRYLLSDAANGLTGKTLSASFDPWASPDFHENTTALSQSSLYTMQRVNLTHLPTDPLAEKISNAARDLSHGD